MQLTNEQEAIFNAIEDGKNILITGVAGTGKSFVINEIQRRFDVDLTATTGIAALNIGGVTIHSWAAIGIGELTAEQVAGKVLHQSWMEPVRKKIQRSKILVIDEISMLSNRMLDLLDQALRKIRYQPNAPFGGIQIVLVGDFLQLPPVIREESPDRFCFYAEVWKEAKIETHLLTKVFRQENQRFANCLHNVRSGTLTEDDIALLMSREGVVPTDIFPICIFAINKQADDLNSSQLEQLQAKPRIFMAEDRPQSAVSDQGLDFHTKRLDRDCLAPKCLQLKVGAQVMLLKNLSFERGLVNGSMGKVIGFYGERLSEEEFDGQHGVDPPPYAHLAPVVEFMNGEIVTMNKGEWVSKEGDREILKRFQYPLRLAWAITAHKAQGMTMDAVFCDLSKVFETGQAYVSLSRAKSLEGLYLKGFDPVRIRANHEALAFYDRLAVPT